MEGEEEATEKPQEETVKEGEEKPREEPVEEEEEKGGMTLEEYLAQRKTVNIKKEARKPEEIKKANIEKAERAEDRNEPKQSSIKNQELYNVSLAVSENAQLLGFQGEEEEYYPRESRRGGRGGRGRGGRGGAHRGGFKAGRVEQTLRLDEEAFPTLA